VDRIWPYYCEPGTRSSPRSFPCLRELCARREAPGRFQAIDLRWGVSKEASLGLRTVPICLTEIERWQRLTPRPNFVILLDHR